MARPGERRSHAAAGETAAQDQDVHRASSARGLNRDKETLASGIGPALNKGKFTKAASDEVELIHLCVLSRASRCDPAVAASPAALLIHGRVVILRCFNRSSSVSS
jgi:hypothetical protein